MSLAYGNINATVMDTKEVSRVREASADGTTFLRTKWTLDLHILVHPSLVSYDGGPPAAPFPAAGIMPAVTDRNIRQMLRTDRQTLIYRVGTDILLHSPAVGETVDANNGPIVEAVDIIQVLADKAILMRFRVVTWVADCGHAVDQNGFPMPSSTNPLVSLRWERHIEVDETHESTMVTEGLATFNVGVLKRLGHYPDQYRRNLVIPPPPNCRRMSVQVAATSDGTGVRFRAVDKELTFNLGVGSAAVKVECYHTAFVQRAGRDAAATGIIVGTLSDIGVGIAGWVGLGGVARRVADRVAPVTPAGSMVPTYHENVLVRAWGNRSSTRTSLTRIALGVAIWRLREIAESHVYELMVQQDVFGKWVEVTMSKKSGIETNLIPGAVATSFPSFSITPAGEVYTGLSLPIGADTVLIPFANPAVGAGEEKIFDPSNVVGGPGFRISQDPAVGNPGPPNSNYTRGTLLEDVVAQVLANACDLGAGSQPANKGFGAEQFYTFPPAP